MARRKPKNGFSILTLILVMIGVAILCGLGVWQVRRLHEKTQYLHRLDALKFAPAEPLNVALNHLQAGHDVDSIRVETACEPGPPAPAARIYAVNDSGAGWRPVVLCRLKFGPYPAVLLDLGIEGQAQSLAPPTTEFVAPSQVTGVLYVQHHGKPMMATATTGAGQFGWRDAQGISAWLGAPDAAPVFLILEQPAVAGVRPAPIQSDISNNHLGYIITWFGLAAALVGVYGAALLRRRRKAA